MTAPPRTTGATGRPNWHWLLADRIPRARLRILKDSGHLYRTEQPGVDEAISASLPKRNGLMRRGDELRGADVIRARAPERGDAVAIVDDHRELTYAALDERSNRLARALPAQAVGPGDRMAYLDHTSPEVVELLFAVGKIGVVIVPMNWRLAAPELLAVLTGYCAQVLIAGGVLELATELDERKAPGGAHRRRRHWAARLRELAIHRSPTVSRGRRSAARTASLRGVVASRSMLSPGVSAIASRWVKRLGCVDLSRRSPAVMFVRSPNSRRLDIMMYAMVVRRLKPGAYERFRRAWEPDSLEHWPAGMTKIWIARSEDDPDVIATWSLFELDEAGYEALRDDPEWMSAELGRVERMSEFETEVLASGFFHVLEEIVPPTVAAD